MDWSALFSTLGLIFVAELGDKTQLAVVTQTCKYRRPWPVFLGASLALTAVTLLGALGGRVLGEFIPAGVLRTIASLAFIVMGAFIAREAIRAKQEGEGLAECALAEPQNAPTARINWQAFGATAGLLFVAELGDKTQLAVLSMATKYASPWAVFAGGATALTLVTAIGVVGGQGLCRLIPERLLLWISAVAFVAMGILMLLGVL